MRISFACAPATGAYWECSACTRSWGIFGNGLSTCHLIAHWNEMPPSRGMWEEPRTHLIEVPDMDDKQGLLALRVEHVTFCFPSRVIETSCAVVG
ncbi:hypothetical protein BS47DRAFT_1151791 [Hydnum rufescens UP504]|uniref:Uncharacterized protein n=1 Tax=Hydnum rufescens UP504 TaxID=1448309 RepID=A0A9P6DZG1_9AGAM|nr:hypothetical protein BS47DRAFT_1151791 [Hydnum rufescens UP504]